MDKTLDSVENLYRLCILGDLKGWIEDRTRAGITGAFGVPGENNNGRRVVELWEERRLCVRNTYFKHIGLHKYTRVAREQDRVEVKSMIDSNADGEGYAAIYAGCEGGERNGMRPLSPLCYTV